MKSVIIADLVNFGSEPGEVIEQEYPSELIIAGDLTVGRV